MRERQDGGWSRRDFLHTLTLAGASGLLGLEPSSFAAEPPPETTRLRLGKAPTICIAPQPQLPRLGRRLRSDRPGAQTEEPRCPRQSQPTQEPPPA